VSKFSEWREKRKAKRWAKKHPNVPFSSWGEDVSGTGFNPRSREASAAVDSDPDLVQVIPTYYEYDEKGAPTGEVKQ
jgi:hypothetical protein